MRCACTAATAFSADVRALLMTTLRPTGLTLRDGIGVQHGETTTALFKDEEDALFYPTIDEATKDGALFQTSGTKDDAPDWEATQAWNASSLLTGIETAGVRDKATMAPLPCPGLMRPPVAFDVLFVDVQPAPMRLSFSQGKKGVNGIRAAGELAKKLISIQKPEATGKLDMERCAEMESEATSQLKHYAAALVDQLYYYSAEYTPMFEGDVTNAWENIAVIMPGIPRPVTTLSRFTPPPFPFRSFPLRNDQTLGCGTEPFDSWYMTINRIR